MKTIDEILEQYYDDTDDFVVTGKGNPEDYKDTAKQAIATIIQEIIGSNDYIPAEDVDGLVNNNRLARDGLRFEQRKRATDRGISLYKEKL